MTATPERTHPPTGIPAPPTLSAVMQLRDQLRAVVAVHRSAPEGWRFRSVEDLVLAVGRFFRPAPLPATARRSRGPERRCFANATHYSRTHQLTYVEGFALYHLGPFATAHAWCVDGYGVVHDPTWPDGAGLAYLGVPFTPAYLDTFERAQGEARVLHDYYLDDYVLLREGVPATAIADIGMDSYAAGGS